jgi:hypothetical protein
MAHKSMNGKEYTNRSQAKHEDRRMEAAKPEPAEQPQEGQPEDESWGDEGEGSQMAQEHGPAVETHVMHDHENNRHMTMVKHPDGHEHQMEHGSAQEAHKYAADCAGGM